jgi:molybdate transport system ATP-binding protein
VTTSPAGRPIPAGLPTPAGLSAPAVGPSVGPSSLEAAFVVARRTFVLEAAISAEPGEVVALMGPNGSGKSTLLNVLAGLTIPDRGTVTLGGRLLTGPGVLVPTERRRVGLMGQDPLLFPHLTALENIAFGPRSQGTSRAQARELAVTWLDRIGLSAMAQRKPAQLSGGQRQRVALARALAARPRLLLLDEPLGALDIGTAPEIRQVLRTHLRATETTTVLVTHDILDSAVLADRMVVLAAGQVVDSGPTLELFASPRSEFAAALAGLNLVPAVVETAGGANSGGLVSVTVAGVALTGVADGPLAGGDRVAAVFAPSAVSVFRTPPEHGSPRNLWPAVVRAMEPGPATVRLRTGDALSVAADVTPAAVAELGIAGGEDVWLAVKATEVRVYRR